MEEPRILDPIVELEKGFCFPQLLETEYFRLYKELYYHKKQSGFPQGIRNYSNLLIYLGEIWEYNEQHAKSYAKRLRQKQKGSDLWRACEAVICEVIIYRHYIRAVYEKLIKSITLHSKEADLIIERFDGEQIFLEAFCVMPELKTSKPGEPVVNDIKTHLQHEMSSIRQKLLRKIKKQGQLSKQRDNIAVIELNETAIAGDFSILSSLSDGFKISIDKTTMKTVSAGYDWRHSVFHDESTRFLRGIIYFSLGDYQNRKYIENPAYQGK